MVFVCFPGGGMSPFETVEEAALREAAEEVGETGPIRILGRTQPVSTPAHSCCCCSCCCCCAVTACVDACRHCIGSVVWGPADVAQIFSSSGFILHPEVSPPLLQPSPDEVQDIFAVPLETLLQQQQQRPRDLQLNLPYFMFDNYVIWGVTAFVLNGVLSNLVVPAMLLQLPEGSSSSSMSSSSRCCNDGGCSSCGELQQLQQQQQNYGLLPPALDSEAP
ncbi:hypothetical protein Esti_001182 [Eimeria stiedai]